MCAIVVIYFLFYALITSHLNTNASKIPNYKNVNYFPSFTKNCDCKSSFLDLTICDQVRSKVKGQSSDSFRRPLQVVTCLFVHKNIEPFLPCVVLVFLLETSDIDMDQKWPQNCQRRPYIGVDMVVYGPLPTSSPPGMPWISCWFLPKTPKLSSSNLARDTEDFNGRKTFSCTALRRLDMWKQSLLCMSLG